MRDSMPTGLELGIWIFGKNQNTKFLKRLGVKTIDNNLF